MLHAVIAGGMGGDGMGLYIIIFYHGDGGWEVGLGAKTSEELASEKRVRLT